MDIKGVSKKPVVPASDLKAFEKSMKVEKRLANSAAITSSWMHLQARTC
jgi:hypothetical protein